MSTSILSLVKKHPILKDPRLFQITALSSFLAYGIFNLDWITDLPRIFTILSAGLIAQLFFMAGLKLPFGSWKSGAITSLGLCLLFQSSTPLMWILAPVLGISSKYFIRTKGKHLFNPANLGVILPIVLFGDAWISPGQWGSSAMLLFFFSSAALMVLFRVGRIDTSLTFLLTILVLEYFRSVVYLGWEFDWLFHKMSNGSLLLFAFFMITDPRTTPNASGARILWAVGIGVLSFVLTSWFYLHTAPMWALFFAAPAMVILDKIFKANVFQWTSIKPLQS
ncbi:MAG: RnfABCDGE type electron transport complex subunit D [Flavobacteriales bacterium]|nr:RnfABCDGE type electron transport complex subunit D [Flavobacteriales bacterium]